MRRIHAQYGPPMRCFDRQFRLQGSNSGAMMGRTIGIMAIVCLVVSPCGSAEAPRAPGGGESHDDSLRIHLPREIAVDSNVPSLGQIGIIHGEASLAVRAGEIAMGRIAAPGQQITIDRLTVLSRLASHGIPAP